LPDELEGVQAVYATDGLNDEEIIGAYFVRGQKSARYRYFS